MGNRQQCGYCANERSESEEDEKRKHKRRFKKNEEFENIEKRLAAV